MLSTTRESKAGVEHWLLAPKSVVNSGIPQLSLSTFPDLGAGLWLLITMAMVLEKEPFMSKDLLRKNISLSKL